MPRKQSTERPERAHIETRSSGLMKRRRTCMCGGVLRTNHSTPLMTTSQANQFRLLHVLKEVHEANRIEAAIPERKPIGISCDIFRPPAGVMQVGDLQRIGSEVYTD